MSNGQAPNDDVEAVEASRRRSRYPAGLIGAVGLILLLDGVLARVPWESAPRSRLSASWQSAIRAAEGPEAGAEVLCFGDSLIKLGIVPRVIEKRLGWSAYNLAVLGGQAPASHYLLRRVLDRGNRPRAVVVNFSPLLLGMDPRVNLEWWAGLIGAGDRLAMFRRSTDPALLGPLILHGVLGSMVARDAVRSALGLITTGPGGGPDRLGPEGIDELVRHWAIHRGAQLAPREFVPIRGSLPHPYRGSRWKWAPHPIHASFVERFLAMAQDRGIPVYWVIPPAEAAWLDRNEGVGTVGAYRSYVRALVGRFSMLTVLDLQRAGWERRWFRDPIHLNRDGAVRLTRAVADVIAAADDPLAVDRRWIVMDDGGPGRHPRLMPELREDLDRSRLAAGRDANGPITMEGPSR